MTLNKSFSKWASLTTPIFLVLGMSSLSLALDIVVDPGHGGSDRGAKRGGFIEADISLKISQFLQEKIESNEQLKAHLTRTKDIDVSLQERVNFAETQKGDFFISVHVNSAPDLKASGAEFYFQLPSVEALENNYETTLFTPNRELASEKNNGPENKVVKTILEDLKQQHRFFRSRNLSMELSDQWQNMKKRRQAIKQAPFFVINRTNMPSVLVEVGFITNPTEARRLSSENTQKEIAEQIYQGILKYKEIIDRDRAALLE